MDLFTAEFHASYIGTHSGKGLRGVLIIAGSFLNLRKIALRSFSVLWSKSEAISSTILSSIPRFLFEFSSTVELLTELQGTAGPSGKVKTSGVSRASSACGVLSLATIVHVLRWVQTGESSPDAARKYRKSSPLFRRKRSVGQRHGKQGERYNFRGE